MYLPSFLRRLAPAHGPAVTHPTRDWFFIVMAAPGLLFLSGAWHVFLFTRLTRGEALDASVPKDASASDVSVHEIRNVFERRATEETKYRSEYQFVDPSTSGG